MNKLRCWECGGELVYADGQPIFAEYTDPIGNRHKLHKDCFKQGSYDKPAITAAPVGEDLYKFTHTLGVKP